MNTLIKSEQILEQKFSETIIGKEEIVNLTRGITLVVFNELSNIYLDQVNSEKYILEIHFNDCNYYEVNIDIEETLETFVSKLSEEFIKERFIDLKSNVVNRNNVRYLRKYNL